MMVYDSDFNLYIFTCDSCGNLKESKTDLLPSSWYEFTYQGKERHLCSKDCAETILSATEEKDEGIEFEMECHYCGSLQ